MPYAATVEVSSFCNLRCPECPTGNNALTREKGLMDTGLYQKILSGIKENTFYINLSFQGEPFMNNMLPEMIRIASGMNFFVNIATNGQFLNEDNCRLIVKNRLSRLLVSFDGIDSQSYEKYRVGGNLQNVIDGVKLLAETKKKENSPFPVIVLQLLVNKFNEKRIEEFKLISRDCGADYFILKSMQITCNKEFLPENSRYSRYFISDGRLIRKKNYKNRCLRLWTTLVVTWQGDVVPCCYDKDAVHRFGNFAGSTLKKIWYDKEFCRFRSTILKNRKSVNICQLCDE